MRPDSEERFLRQVVGIVPGGDTSQERAHRLLVPIDQHVERALGAVADRGDQRVVTLVHLVFGSDDRGEQETQRAD